MPGITNNCPRPLHDPRQSSREREESGRGARWREWMVQLGEGSIGYRGEV